MMLVDAVPGDDAGGVKFVAHATRFERYMNMGMDNLRLVLWPTSSRPWISPAPVRTSLLCSSLCSSLYLLQNVRGEDEAYLVPLVLRKSPDRERRRGASAGGFSRSARGICRDSGCGYRLGGQGWPGRTAAASAVSQHGMRCQRLIATRPSTPPTVGRATPLQGMPK